MINKLVADRQLFEDVEDSPPPPAVAFIYFDFQDKGSQNVEIALRRIVLQLSAQSPHPYRALDKQYASTKGQTLPTSQDLLKVLQQLLREIGRTYIVFDALDECEDRDVEQLLNFIATLRRWTETPLHVFITSQPRQVFAESFADVPSIALEFDVTHEDIKFFVASELQIKSSLRLWRPQADHITDRVARKSKGMSVF